MHTGKPWYPFAESLRRKQGKEWRFSNSRKCHSSLSKCAEWDAHHFGNRFSGFVDGLEDFVLFSSLRCDRFSASCRIYYYSPVSKIWMIYFRVFNCHHIGHSTGKFLICIQLFCLILASIAPFWWRHKILRGETVRQPLPHSFKFLQP